MPPDTDLAQADTTLTIRPAVPSEYPAVGELTVRAYATVGDPIQGTAIYRAYEKELRDVAGRAATCLVLVALEPGGRIVGAVTYVPGPGTPWSESERDGEAGFRALAVDPDARRGGVGRALTMACVEQARTDGRRGIAILTRPAMTAAHRLYESLGFVRDRSRDWEFEPGLWLWSYVLAI
jgi:ribosomal protein S18 acetylase RimI-like enzyme